MEAFDRSADGSGALFWLQTASEAMSRIAAGATRRDTEAMARQAKAIRRELFQSWRWSGRSAIDAKLTALGLQHTEIIAERSGNAEQLVRWREEAGDFVASLPVAVQGELPPGLRADEHYFRAAVAALGLPRLEESRRLLAKIDHLAVRRETSSFHMARLHDALAVSDRLAAFRMARDWARSHVADRSGALISRVASGALSTIAPGNEPEMRDALALLDELETAHAEAVAAGDQTGARVALDPARPQRPLERWEREAVSSQILLSRIYIASALRDERTRAWAEEFLDVYPAHPGAASVVEALRRLERIDLHGGAER